MDELRRAVIILKEAIGTDKRKKEYKAIKLIEETLFPANVWTEEEIERIINEVMGSEAY